MAAGANYAAPPNKTCAVTVDLPSTTLADNTPAMIQAAAKAGMAPNFWRVGDKIGIKINGSFGGLSYNDTVYAVILGFNHNSGVEGNNSIHFQFGKNSEGVDIAFAKDYGRNWTGFCMNTIQANSGGWKNCYMRNTICPAFFSAMPTEWQNVIADCTKYTFSWWLRSTWYNDADNFCLVDKFGNMNTDFADPSYGFAPGFMVA